MDIHMGKISVSLINHTECMPGQILNHHYPHYVCGARFHQLLVWATKLLKRMLHSITCPHVSHSPSVPTFVRLTFQLTPLRSNFPRENNVSSLHRHAFVFRALLCFLQFFTRIPRQPNPLRAEQTMELAKICNFKVVWKPVLHFHLRVKQSGQ